MHGVTVAENVKGPSAEQIIATIVVGKAGIVAMVGNGVTAGIDEIAGTTTMVAGTVEMPGTVTAATAESKIIVIGVTEEIVMTPVRITIVKEGQGKTVKTAVMVIVGITGMIPGIATAKGNGQIGHIRMRNVKEAIGE